MVGWEVAVPALHAVQRGLQPTGVPPQKARPPNFFFLPCFCGLRVLEVSFLLVLQALILAWVSFWQQLCIRNRWNCGTGGVISQISNGVSLIN